MCTTFTRISRITYGHVQRHIFALNLDLHLFTKSFRFPLIPEVSVIFISRVIFFEVSYALKLTLPTLQLVKTKNPENTFLFLAVTIMTLWGVSDRWVTQLEIFPNGECLIKLTSCGAPGFTAALLYCELYGTQSFLVC